MRIPRRTVGKGCPAGISLDALADALMTLKTARFSEQGLYAGHAHDRPYAIEGVSDFGARQAHHRGHIGERPIELIVSGDQVFHRLTPAAEAQFGKRWMLSPHPCGGELFGDTRELSAAVRAVGPSKVSRTVEDGLLRCAIPIAPSLRSADPVIRHMAAHLRHHGVLRMTLDIWVDEDLTIRRLRAHHRRLRSVSVVPLIEMTVEYRDFGVPMRIEEPDAEDVVPDPKPPASYWGR